MRFLKLAGLSLAIIWCACISDRAAWAETFFQTSSRLIATGQISEARRALRSELRVRPENIEARYNLALLLQEIDHQSDALLLYKENLAMAWHLPSVVNLAQLLEMQGKKEEARQWLQQASKAIKFEAAPWYLLAKAAEKEGDMVSARALYDKAIKADPLNGFARLYRAEFKFHQQRDDHGLKDAAKAMGLLPRCAPCWSVYGEMLEAEGLHAQALGAYQRSQAIQPDDVTRK
ncbi:MAG: hypothetical protein Q9M17_10335, partial [Mariprofundus sp.]|nr:hypothetical protein [Mariprofundus sp.]